MYVIILLSIVHKAVVVGTAAIAVDMLVAVAYYLPYF